MYPTSSPLGTPPQWRNETPGAPATPEGAVIGGRRIVIKMWDNFARLTALLAKVRVCFNNSTIYLDFSAIFSEIAPSKLVTEGTPADLPNFSQDGMLRN